MKFVPAISMILIILSIISCGSDKALPGGSGLIESTEIIISSESAGTLEALYCQEGDQMYTGDTICMIDTVTISLKLNQANALYRAAETQLDMASLNKEQAAYNYSLAKKEFDRATSLIKSGSVNQQLYDKMENAFNLSELAKKRAETGLNAARADLNRIQAEIAILNKQFDNCFPTSPLNGRVTDKFIDAGELVGPGAPLVKLSRLDTVWVKVYLPPADLTGIKLAKEAMVDPEDGGEIMTGYITWISSEAEFTPKNIQTREARADLVYAVKITIPNPDERLKIGMPVSVTLP